MAKVEWLPNTERKQAILQIEVAVPGLEAMSGKIEIPRSQFGMNVDLEQLRVEGTALLDSILLNIRLSMDSVPRVNSRNAHDKE